jgi:glycosyltransferase involved in cell wall biosynthesis
MRILMILEVPFPPHPRVEKEMRTLTRVGHDVHVVAYGSAGRPDHEFVEGLGTIHRVPFPMGLRPFRLLHGGRFLYDRYWRPRVAGIVGSLRPDALHVHDLPLARAAFAAAQRAGIPLVLDFHENWPGFMRWAAKSLPAAARHLVDFRGWERYEAEAVAWAARIIVVDPSNQDRLVERYRVSGDRVAVVSNVPELERLVPAIERARELATRGRTDTSADGGTLDDAAARGGTLSDAATHRANAPGSGGRLTLLYMGGLDFGRGIHTVLDAIAERRSELDGLRFVIVGKGSYAAALEQRAARLGLAGLVEFHGWQPYDRLPEYLATADIGTVPHVRDELTDTTIPNKIFEYMSAELPVLSSDCAPLTRIVETASCGLVFRSEDAASCGEQLVRLCRDAGLRRKLGQSGHEAVIREHNWEHAGRTLADLYAEIAKTIGRAQAASSEDARA